MPPPRGAAIIAVGTELLGPGRTDRNTPLLKGWLAGHGQTVVFQAVVPDDESVLEDTLTRALARCRFVFVTGGLGPTTDDRTRFAAARAVGVPLEEDEAVLDEIRARFRAREMPMPEVNRTQALLPKGAVALRNPLGTAPGVLFRSGGGASLVLLPGPPAELAAVLEAGARSCIADGLGLETASASAALVVAGLPESVLQERILDLTTASRGPEVAILPSGWEIEIRITAPAVIAQEPDVRDEDAARRAAEVARLADRIAARLGDAVFSRVSGERLEHAVGRLLDQRGERAAFAESLTGGLIAERITRVAGASRWFDLGVVAYANEAKRELLGVPEASLRTDGAVSEAVAVAMAEGVRRRSGNAWGVSVTGIAGPGGGSADKPVGLVWIAVSGPVSRVERFRFPGDRALVRRLTAALALDLLRRALLRDGGGTP